MQRLLRGFWFYGGKGSRGFISRNSSNGQTVVVSRLVSARVAIGVAGKIGEGGERLRFGGGTVSGDGLR